MKPQLIKILSFLLLLFFSVSLNAQCVPYEKTIPQNATISDIIYLEVKHCNNNSPCALVGENVTIDTANNQIQASGTYEPCSPFANPTMCETTDQIQIGQLDAGSYTLEFSKISCHSGDTMVTKNLNFTVQDTGGVSADIDSLRILPSNPFDDDTVKVVGHTSFDKSVCNMSNTSITLGSDSVYVDAYHVEGSLPATCNNTDTTVIGKLDTGTYTLKYRIRDSATSALLDSATVSFYVQESLNPACIDSINILPVNATTQDSVDVIAYTYFPSSPCYMSGAAIDKGSDTVRIRAGYVSGIATAICHSTDTTNIGMLSAGNYQLFYYMVDSVSNDTLDIKTSSLSITSPSGISETPADIQPRVYPNPANENVYVDLSTLPANKFTIELYSITGQNVKSVITAERLLSIDLRGLKEGMYFMVITDKQGRQWTHKLVKRS
ncbi:MAG: T9SS type A sorting domain-containing protein [Bacteroidales bacterium]